MALAARRAHASEQLAPHTHRRLVHARRPLRALLMRRHRPLAPRTTEVQQRPQADWLAMIFSQPTEGAEPCGDGSSNGTQQAGKGARAQRAKRQSPPAVTAVAGQWGSSRGGDNTGANIELLQRPVPALPRTAPPPAALATLLPGLPAATPCSHKRRNCKEAQLIACAAVSHRTAVTGARPPARTCCCILQSAFSSATPAATLAEPSLIRPVKPGSGP